MSSARRTRPDAEVITHSHGFRRLSAAYHRGRRDRARIRLGPLPPTFRSSSWCDTTPPSKARGRARACNVRGLYRALRRRGDAFDSRRDGAHGRGRRRIWHAARRARRNRRGDRWRHVRLSDRTRGGRRNPDPPGRTPTGQGRGRFSRGRLLAICCSCAWCRCFRSGSSISSLR